MFGAQSAMAQMQSAPSLPAGNPGAREYFNYSMETLSNAAMPRAMMPQGISSLVPQYQSGGDVSLAEAMSMAVSEPSIEGVEAALDAAGISVPGFNAPDVSGPDPFSPDAAMAEAALAEQEDAQMQQVASDLNDLMSQMQGEAARGTFSKDDAVQFQAQQAAQEALSGINQTNIGGTSSPPPSLLQSALNLADKYAMPSGRGPGILAAAFPFPFSLIPTAVTLGAKAIGLTPDSGEWGEFPGDAVNPPSQSELDQRFAEPDSGNPDSGNPNSGNPVQAPPAAAPAYVPPVYQTYAGLGLPSVSPIPPLRRVTVPISSFVV